MHKYNPLNTTVIQHFNFTIKQSSETTENQIYQWDIMKVNQDQDCNDLDQNQTD